LFAKAILSTATDLSIRFFSGTAVRNTSAKEDAALADQWIVDSEQDVATSIFCSVWTASKEEHNMRKITVLFTSAAGTFMDAEYELRRYSGRFLKVLINAEGADFFD
jgi:hypothetical protein